MDQRAPLVTLDELRKVVGLLQVVAEGGDDFGTEAGQLAHDLAFRLPAD